MPATVSERMDVILDALRRLHDTIQSDPVNTNHDKAMEEMFWLIAATLRHIMLDQNSLQARIAKLDLAQPDQQDDTAPPPVEGDICPSPHAENGQHAWHIMQTNASSKETGDRGIGIACTHCGAEFIELEADAIARYVAMQQQAREVEQ